MSGRRRTLSTAPVVGAVAGEPPNGPLSGPLRGPQGPAHPGIPAGAPTAASVHVAPSAGAVAAGPATGPAPRLADTGMPASERAEWRHRLRAGAGKLAQAIRAANAAEDGWNRVAAQARTAGVPEAMLTAALADAGLSTDA